MQPPAVDVGGESFVLTGKVFGRGGFGTVYEARSPKGETAAVKIVDVEGLSAEAQMRLDMESTSHERAGTHPNIVGFYGSIRQGPRQIFVQEAMPGGDLLDLVLASRQGLPEYQVQSMVAQVLQALCWLHRKGICHGDVKPENILCGHNQHSVKLTDFGLASLLPSDGSTPPLPPVGSPLYLPPEDVVSFAADVWAAGITTYVLLSGNFPYGSAEDAATLAPAFDAECWARSSPLAQDFIEAMLRRDASERPSAEEALRHPWLAHVRAATPLHRRPRERSKAETPPSKRHRATSSDLGLASKRQLLSSLHNLVSHNPLAPPAERLAVRGGRLATFNALNAPQTC